MKRRTFVSFAPFFVTFVLLFAALACTLPGSVGYDEKRPPENAGTPIPPLTPAPSDAVASPMPTLAAPPTAAVQLETGEDVRQFMLYSFKRWHTLWADLTVEYYTGDGSATPVQTMRTMVWISQPDHMRALSAADGATINWMWVSDGAYYAENAGAAQPVSGLAVAYEPPISFSDTIYAHPLEGVIGSPAGALIFPQGLTQRYGQYQIVGQEQQSGRDAIVIEWSREPGIVIDRFWVDAQYGFILGWINFSKPGGGAINTRMWVADVLIDVPMPENAFAVGQPVPSGFPTQSGDLPPAP